MYLLFIFVFFFFNDTATTEIYTLSLHDALPTSPARPPATCMRFSVASRPAGSRSSKRGTGRPTRLRSALPGCSPTSTARRAPLASGRMRPAPRCRSRTWSTTSTRWMIWTVWPRASGRTLPRRLPERSCEGRATRGRLRRLALRPRAGGDGGSREPDRDRERGRRRRGARSPRLARPRLGALHARRGFRYGARLGAAGRELERARDRRGARRRRLVQARRPRHRV